MISDLSPSMTSVLANIGTGSASATEMGVNGSVMKRLWKLGFLKMDLEPSGRLAPYYSLSERGIGAAAVLNAALPVPDHYEPPIARIKRKTAEHYRIPAIEMVSARRARKVARPRQVAMYLAKKLTPKSLPEIGRSFGNRDHTTVIHAVRTVAQLIADNADFGHEVKTLLDSIVSEEKAVESGGNSIVNTPSAGA